MKLLKIYDGVFLNLEKGQARAIHKYYKREPKKSGKGWNYFYTKEQWQHYKKTGQLPEQKHHNWLDAIAGFFHFKSKDQAKTRIKEDYKANEIKSKFSMSFSDWKRHVQEYFNNKEKWQNFFSKTKTGGGKTGGKSGGKSKESSGKSGGGMGFKTSVMRFINELYGKQPEKPKEVEKTEEPKQPEKTKPEEPVTPPIEPPTEPGGETTTGGEGRGKDKKERKKREKKLTKKEKEKIRKQKEKEEEQARTGYFNEKPSDVLNVGQDVWGARRHKFTTYEHGKGVSIDQMEKDGSALAFVTKKNMLGDYGLANKDERVKNGETEYKVLASFAIRHYLNKIPPDTAYARNKYAEFCSEITRIDNETKDAMTFMNRLADSVKNIFIGDISWKGDDWDKLSQEEKDAYKQRMADERSLPGYLTTDKIIGGALKESLVRNGNIWNIQDQKQKDGFRNLESIYRSDVPTGETKTPYYKTYDQIKKDILGEFKAAGVKVKKGDNITFSDDLKNNVYASKREIIKGKEEEYRKTKEQYDKMSDDVYNSEKSRLEAIQDYFKMKFEDLYEAQEHYRTVRGKIYEKMNSFLEEKKLYPVGKGQVIKVKKDGVYVSFKFEDDLTRTFSLKPNEIKPESVESIKRDITDKDTIRIDLNFEKNVRRNGGSDHSKLTAKQAQDVLEKEYKFKAVQYGNSMPATEREYHTKWSVDAFSDLSDILQLPVEQLTLNGKLGIAFGARGQTPPPGQQGAVAHYETGTKMINLTRANGFGSLAHEWGHFIDNILTPNMDGFLSSSPGFESQSLPSSQMKHGYIHTIGKTRYFYDANKEGEYYPWAKLKKGQTEPNDKSRYYHIRSKGYSGTIDVKVPLSTGLSVVMNEIGTKSQKAMHDQIDKKMKAMLAESPENLKSGMYITLAAVKDHDYYNRLHECLARAFEGYVADKLEEKGRENTYLTSKKKTSERFGEYLYPQGEARKEINMLFDKFFETIRNSGDLKKAIKRYIKIYGKVYKRVE